MGDFGPVNGYGSRGRKRGKDVIDMTIEEMEAEIQETNEAIWKRRRRTPGAHAEAPMDAHGVRVSGKEPRGSLHRVRLLQPEQCG